MQRRALRLRSQPGLGKQVRFSQLHRTASATAAALSGRVLLTREAGKNNALRQRLEAKQIGSYELPMVCTEDGPDAATLPQVLEKNTFDWVAVTSPEAARVLATAWRATPARPALRIAAVGKGTADALQQAEPALGAPAFMPSVANAVSFAAELPAADSGGGAAGAGTVLYPASRKAGTTLQRGLAQRGFECTRLDTYDTGRVAACSGAERDAALACAVVAVGSPSALKAYAALVGVDAARAQAIACIGSTSGEAARALGFAEAQTFWHDAPGLDGWVDSVEAALRYAEAQEQGLHVHGGGAMSA